MNWDCDELQTMAHLLCCRLLDEPCSPKHLIIVTAGKGMCPLVATCYVTGTREEHISVLFKHFKYRNSTTFSQQISTSAAFNCAEGGGGKLQYNVIYWQHSVHAFQLHPFWTQTIQWLCSGIWCTPWGWPYGWVTISRLPLFFTIWCQGNAGHIYLTTDTTFLK